MNKQPNHEFYKLESCVAKLSLLGLQDASNALKRELTLQIVGRELKPHQLLGLLKELGQIQENELSVPQIDVVQLVKGLIQELSELESAPNIQHSTKTYIQMASVELTGHLIKLLEDKKC